MVFAGETEALEENLPRLHFVHHKSHLPDPGANPGQQLATSAMTRPMHTCIPKHITVTISAYAKFLLWNGVIT
jgi:hypothetical protein